MWNILEGAVRNPGYATFAERWNRSNATSNNETAAGVTPEILEACPTVAGLTFDSFSATSFENPVTRSYRKFAGMLFPSSF